VSLRNSLIFSVRWHRRIGLLCALLVLVLSVTGILLNHTSSLKLGSIKIHSAIIANLYGLPSPEPVSIAIKEQWVSHDGFQQLYLQDKAIAQCAAPLLGAAQHHGLLHILCKDVLLLLSQEGELLEAITPVLGLPANLQTLTQHKDQLLLKTTTGVLNANLDTLQWLPSNETSVQWPTLQAVPPQLSQAVNTEAPAIDLEQLLLDLHSGRLFGSVGVLIMDMAAVLLIVLSITGFIAWYSSKQLRKGKRR